MFAQMLEFGQFLSQDVLQEPLEFKRCRIRYRKPTKIFNPVTLEATDVEDISKLGLECDNYTSVRSQSDNGAT